MMQVEKPMSLDERLEYAVNLIEQVNGNEQSERQKLYWALEVLDFGNVTVKQMIFYLGKRR